MDSHGGFDETLEIPDPRLLDDEGVAERWAWERIARSDGARTTDERRKFLLQIAAARDRIDMFMRRLNTGDDPWEKLPSGRSHALYLDDRDILELAVKGLRRRGFTVSDVKDEYEKYNAIAETPPPGLSRWSVTVVDPIFSLLP